MRLGLLGGTFNPIHLGHLRGAEEAREAFDLGRIYFIPTAIPPHKNDRIEVSPAKRLELVRLAIEDNPAFSASDVELSRPGKSYSVDTVLFFRDRHPRAEIFFIVGMDSFLEITMWKSYETLFSLCNFVVLNRPGAVRPELRDLTPREFWKAFHPAGNPNQWVHGPSGLSTYFMATPLIDISSSEIRERIRNGASVRYMMPEKVEAYVLRKGFYVTSQDTGQKSS